MKSKIPTTGHSLSIIREAKDTRTFFRTSKQSRIESQKKISRRCWSKHLQRSKRCLDRSIVYERFKRPRFFANTIKGFGFRSKSPLQSKFDSGKGLNVIQSDRQISNLKNKIKDIKFCKENDSFLNSSALKTMKHKRMAGKDLNKLNIPKKLSYQINNNLPFLRIKERSLGLQNRKSSRNIWKQNYMESEKIIKFHFEGNNKNSIQNISKFKQKKKKFVKKESKKGSIQALNQKFKSKIDFKLKTKQRSVQPNKSNLGFISTKNIHFKNTMTQSFMKASKKSKNKGQSFLNNRKTKKESTSCKNIHTFKNKLAKGEILIDFQTENSFKDKKTKTNLKSKKNTKGNKNVRTKLKDIKNRSIFNIIIPDSVFNVKEKTSIAKKLTKCWKRKNKSYFKNDKSQFEEKKKFNSPKFPIEENKFKKKKKILKKLKKIENENENENKFSNFTKRKKSNPPKIENKFKSESLRILNRKKHSFFNSENKQFMKSKKEEINPIDESASIQSEILDSEFEEKLMQKLEEFRDKIKKKIPIDEDFKNVKKMLKEIFEETGEESWLLTFQTSLDFYKIKKEIGKGSFGKVYHATQILTNTEVALKKICKSTIRKKRVEEKIHREIKILKNLNKHNNIIKLYEVFEDQDNFYLVFEYLENGDLVSFFRKNDLFEEDYLKKFFYKILKGLKCIHAKGVIHRDIKPENILLDSEMNPKIADFGISSIYKVREPILDTGGTPIYLAPEVIRSQGKINFKTDVWSCGILLYLLTFGNVPFTAEKVQDLYEKILIQDFEFPNMPANGFPEGRDALENLLKRMLIKDSLTRISLDECLEHPYFDDLECKDYISDEPEEESFNELSSFSQFDSNIFSKILGMSEGNNQQFQSSTIHRLVNSCRDIGFINFKNKLNKINDPDIRPIKIEKSLITKKPFERKIISDMNVIFNSSTGLTNENLNNERDKMKNKSMLNEDNVNELKFKIIIQFLKECNFPENYICKILSQNDRKFTHMRSCYDILFESL